LCEEGFGFRSKPSAIDPAGIVSDRQIPQSRLEATRDQRFEVLVMARDNRNHALHDGDIVFPGNGPVEDRFDARLVFRGETPLSAELGEVRIRIPQEQISLAFLCLLFLGLFAVLAYVLITS
jgi:hypothetical protein